MYFNTLGNRGRNKTRRKTPPSDSGGPFSPNHISSQFDNTGRMHQLKQQLSTPARKSRYEMISQLQILLHPPNKLVMIIK